MKFINFLVLISFIVLFSCASTKNITIVSQEKSTNLSIKDTIPFKFIRNVIIVNVNINGNNCNMLFETGAQNLLVDSTIYKADLSNCITKKITGADKSLKKLKRVNINNAQWGKFKLNNLPATYIDRCVFEDYIGVHISGLLSVKIFENKCIKIDYESNKIIVASDISAFNMIGNHKKIELRRRKKLLYFRIKTDNKRYSCLLDTGYNGDITFNNKNERNDLNNLKTYNLTSTIHKHNKIDSIETVIENIKLVNIIEDDLILENRKIEYNENRSNLVGNSFLKSFKDVIIDFPNKSIYLNTSNISQSNTSFCSFGLTILGQNMKFVIAKIIKNSSAYNKGLKIGDKVIKIDDMTLNEDTSFIKIKEYLNNDERKTVIIKYLNKDGEINTVTLSKQKF